MRYRRARETWKTNLVHLEAQQACDKWYLDSRIRVCKFLTQE